MKRKHLAQLLAGLLISAAALYFLVFKNVSIKDILTCFQDFRYVWLIPTLAVFYFGVWLRGIRWKWLFLPRHHVSLKNTTAGIFICFAFNSIFPGRAGEFARAYLIGKQEKTGFSTALGTVVCERLIDAVTLLIMWALVFLMEGGALVPPDAEVKIGVFGWESLTGKEFLTGARGIVVLAIALFAFIACVRVPRTRGWILRALHAFRFVPAGLRHKAEHLVHRFSEGLESLSSPGRLVLLILFSFLVWVTNSLAVLWLSYGFDFAHTMTLPQSLALIVIASFFIMIPAAPGYWGLFEAGVIFAIVIMGIHPANDAMVRSYAILLHLTQWLPIVAIGLPWAWASHVSLGEVAKAEAAAGDGPAATPD